jgi:hypothetical protein
MTYGYKNLRTEVKKNRLQLDRRGFLKLLGAGALGGICAPLLGAAGPSRLCRPLISGALWWLAKPTLDWGESGWRDELDQQRRIGFSLLWLNNVPRALQESPDAVLSIMDLCARRKVKVILDTGTSHKWYNPFEPAQELDFCGGNIIRVAERLRGHPAFSAWYVSHEIYMDWGKRAEQISDLYCGLVERCKNAADLPVTLSPFFILDRDRVFGNFRYNEPDEYESYWTRLIRQADFDVIMLQDSGEHFSYVTNEMRRPFFKAMQAACRNSGAKLWGNVETAEFECDSIEEYIRRYGRVHHSTVKDAPWRPVPLDRLRDKLELAAEYCEDIVTWGYREFCRPSLGPAAEKWHQDYSRYHRQVLSQSR